MKAKTKELINKIKEKPLLRFPLGILCIIIGIIGGFIPILQGWMFILVGCILLFSEEKIENIRNKIKKIRKKKEENDTQSKK